jgi:hypothetical protein
MLIPKEALEVVRLGSDEAGRHGLTGVLVERKAGRNPRLVASDGKYLGIVEWTEADHSEYPAGHNPAPGPDLRVILAGDSCREAMKLPDKRSARNIPILNNIVLDETAVKLPAESEGAVPISCGMNGPTKRIEGKLLDGNFPDTPQ